jgi:hypothetical protein
MRGEVLRMINRSAHKAGASSSLYLATMLWGQRMAPPAEAQRLALESDFCFCPTGDAKGFTARFYFSLLLGCLPVRVDGWEPHWEPGRLHSGQLKMNTTSVQLKMSNPQHSSGCGLRRAVGLWL